MDRIARIIVSHSRPILAATAVVSLIAVAMLFRMQFNADISSFALTGSEAGESFVALQEKYGSADPINVVVTLPEGETFNSKAGLVKLVKLRDEIRGVEGVESVATIVPDENPVTGAPITAADIEVAPEAIVVSLIEESPVASLLLDDSGRNTLMLVMPADDAVALARRLADLEPPGGVELTLSGNPVIFATVLGIMSWFLLIIPPLVIALLVGVFYLTIGDLRLSALSLLPAGLGALWTFGLIFGLGLKVDIVTLLVPIFVIVMGSADGLHFVTHFQESAQQSDSVGRVRAALSEVGVPMILTTVSTAAGFLSLLATGVSPIRQLGLFAAIGICFAGVISFFSLPALMSRVSVKTTGEDAVLGPRVTTGLKALVRSRTPAIVLCGAIVLFAAIFIPRLQVDSDQLFFFKDGDPVREAFAKTEEVFGGATPLAGEFVFEPAQGLIGLDQITAVARFRATPGDSESLLNRGCCDCTEPGGDAGSRQRWDHLPARRHGERRRAAFHGVPLRLHHGGPRNVGGVRRGDPGDPHSDRDADRVGRDRASCPQRSDDLDRRRVRIGLSDARYRIPQHPRDARLPRPDCAHHCDGARIPGSVRYQSEPRNSRPLEHRHRRGDRLRDPLHCGNQPRAAGWRRLRLRGIDRAGRPIVANALGIAVAMTALWFSPLKVHSQVSMIMWVAMITSALSAIMVIPMFLPRAGVRGEGAAQARDASA